MTRTLVISDLHIGSRRGASTIQQPSPQQLLLDTLDHVDRLVLLGDVLELVEANPARSVEVAEPILQAIGKRLGPEREVVLVPGNHDYAFVRGWVREQGPALHTETTVPADATPALARVVAALGSAGSRVVVSYPGVWLSETVWATHGHYLDLEMFPVSAYGLVRGRRRRDVRAALPSDYERARRFQLSRAMRWLPDPLAEAVEELGEVVRASTMPRLQRKVLHRRLAPVTAKLLGMQMRRHSLPALARVVENLGIQAEWVVFGHVHRLGPLPGDDFREWRGPRGGPKLLNTGAWRYEPLLVHRAGPAHPYWPGGAVMLDGDGTPRAVGLLERLPAHELHAPTR